MLRLVSSAGESEHFPFLEDTGGGMDEDDYIVMGRDSVCEGEEKFK